MRARGFFKGLLIFGMVMTLAMAGSWAHSAEKEYPNREIEIVVPFSAGGMVDLAVRVIADELAKNLGVPTVIVTKAGAGGTIGAQYVSQAKPDGYTLLLGPHSLYCIEPALQPNLPYKTTDLVPVARFVNYPFVLAVRKAAPWKTFEELIAYAKKTPGKMSYASSGVGSGSHVIVEMLKVEAGLDIQHIPYKGGPGQLVAVLGGHSDFLYCGLPAVLPELRSGDLRPLVAAEKIPEFPKIPTVAEKGYPGSALASWAAFSVPKGTPKAVIDKIANAVEKAVKVPKLAAKLQDIGGSVQFVAKEELGQEIERDIKRMTEFIKKAKLI